ncbi:hypothetical protein ABBQ38_004834 [Trebouxia sp. C0009 RCD-2024]
MAARFVMVVALALGSASAQSDWKVGRATFYGTDGWSIHQGSCGFYYIFELADTKWGVIGLQWRAVPCDYMPANPAPAPAHPTPGHKPPKGTERPPPGYWNKPRSQWPGQSGSLESDVDASMRMPGAIYNQTLVNNWTIQGYNTILYPNASAPGVAELNTQCAIIAPNSSFTFTAPGPGFFLGKLSIAFWAQYAMTAEDLQLTLAASDPTLPQGTCAKLTIAGLIPSPSDPLLHPDMMGYTMYLGAFQNSTARAGPNALAFQGCPGVSPVNIDQVIFINTGTNVQQLCLDNVQLLDGNEP